VVKGETKSRIESLPSTNNHASSIVTGDEDDACIQSSLFLKQTIPASGLAMFAMTGHILNIEEPALFNEKLARSGHGGSRAMAAARSPLEVKP
jgi:3-oxoadipate enol-lactonase